MRSLFSATAFPSTANFISAGPEIAASTTQVKLSQLQSKKKKDSRCPRELHLYLSIFFRCKRKIWPKFFFAKLDVKLFIKISINFIINNSFPPNKINFKKTENFNHYLKKNYEDKSIEMWSERRQALPRTIRTKRSNYTNER